MPSTLMRRASQTELSPPASAHRFSPSLWCQDIGNMQGSVEYGSCQTMWMAADEGLPRLMLGTGSTNRQASRR